MVMSSHQIGAMAMQQQAMFGNFQSYAQQITPPYGAGPGMGALRPPAFGGYHAGPPPMMPPPPPPMPGWNPGYSGGIGQMAMGMPFVPTMGQAMGEQLVGSGLAGLSTVGAGAARIGGMATMGAGALSMLGVGGAGMAALGGGPGMLAMAGIELGAFGAQHMYQGFQERQQVNRVLRQRFGGMMGIGGGRGGTGFSPQDMGQISTMVRGMAAEDMYTSFDELTRLMDRTAQMGLYRGVQGARQFQTRFKETVSALREIAQTMHTSLEGATQFMEQARNQGFFSGQDISRTLMQTRMAAGASGMSMDQMMMLRGQGTQMGRMLGMRGRQGATAMMNMATNLGVGMQTGMISDELIAEATGGLTGAEGAQAAAASMMQANARWMRRGAGRVMLAGLWDPESGGINMSRLQQAMSGGTSFQEIRAMGRANVAATGGRRSEFFANEERIAGMLQETGLAQAVQFGMLEQHIQRARGVTADDPIGERFMRRQMGLDQAQFELVREQYRNMPRILAERRVRTRTQASVEQNLRAREGRGLEGMRRRVSHWWESDVVGKIHQEGDNLVTDMTSAIDNIFAEAEGRVKTTIDQRVKEAVAEFGRTGEIAKGGMLMGDVEFSAFSRQLRGSEAYQRAGETSPLAKLGRRAGLRGMTLRERAGRGQLDVFRQRRWAGEKGTLVGDAAIEEAVNEATRKLAFDPVTAGIGYTTSDIEQLQTETMRLVTQKRFGYGKDQDAALARWRTLREDSPMAAARDQIDWLMANSEAHRKYFEKVGEDPYQRAAALRRLEERYAGTSYTAGVENIAGGMSSEEIGRQIATLDQKKRDLISRYEARRRVGVAERVGEGIRTTATVQGLAGLFTRAGREKFTTMMRGEGEVQGLPLGRMLENEKLSDLMRTAVMSDDPQARADAISAMRVAAGEGNAPKEIPGISRQSVLDMASDLHNRDSALSKDLKDYFTGEQYRATLLTVDESRRQGAELQQYSQRYRADIEAALGSKPEMLQAYNAMVEARARGGLEESRRLENEFYAKYGGSKEATSLMGILQREEGGAGAFVGYGLELTQQYIAGAGKGKQRERNLLNTFLRDMGVAGGLEAAFGRDPKGRKAIDELLQKISTTGAGAQEDLLKQLQTQGVLGGVNVEVFRQEGAALLTAMRDSTKDSELAQLAARRASGAAEGARVEGAAPERQRSPAELAQKQVDLLGTLVQLTAIANRDRAGLSSEERATIERALGKKQNINVTVANPSGGASGYEDPGAQQSVQVEEWER